MMQLFLIIRLMYKRRLLKSRNGMRFLNFIKNGKAFIGFHAASDGGMSQWQEYTDMIGGCFAGHPWNAGGKWPFFVEDVKPSY